MTDTSSPARRAVTTATADLTDELPETGQSLARQVSRGAAWALLANFTMRFASVAVTAILARILAKEEFGVFAVALAVYLVVASLAELGMASAVARSPLEPKEIAPTVASISILVSGGSAILLALGAPVLASGLGQPAAAEPIRVLALCLFLTGVFAVPGAQLVREFRQDRIFLATIVGFVVSNPILILLALNGGGATSFAWSRVVGQVATGVVFVLSTSHRYRPGWRREVVGSLLRFGLPLSLANLVNWTLLNADYMILGRLVDAALVGVYMIAFNVANWSTAVLGSVLNSVVLPAFGRVKHDKLRLSSALAESTQLVALLALPVGALSLALSEPLILALFTEKWSEAAPVLAVLSLYGVLYAFSLLFANVLVAIGKTLRLLLIQLGWIVVLAPAIVIAVQRWGLGGVAWAHVITIGLIAVPAYLIAALSATGQRLTSVLRGVARPALGAVIAGAAAWLTASAFDPAWLRLVAGGLVGCVVYLLVTAPLVVRRLPERIVPSWIPAGWRGSRPGSGDRPDA